MGNCVSFQVSCDETLNQIFKCLCGETYIRTIKQNLRVLEREMKNLKALKEDVQNKVEREEASHQQRLAVVQVWLIRVESIDTRFRNVFSASNVQLQNLCLFGLCSKNICSSYKYGKKVFLLLEEVKILKTEGNFEVVTKPVPKSEVDERPTRPTIGQEKMLEKAWNRLMEDGIGIMGFHGMGGVGKTTLFKQIHNKFAKMSSTFGVVIWIVVSQGANISKIQKDIAEKLHIYEEAWKNKNEFGNAAEINSVLQGRRFVLMLDDMWEKVDLEAIGVPFPSRENKCKVTFTTRSQEVCGQMGDHEPMQVKCLESDEAWELFKNKVGDYTLRRDPIIVELARKVAEECRGLPLALCVIGEAMTSKTMVQEWEHAIDILSRNAAEFSDMENKILPILKYSYDSLVDEHIKSCFLYCALFPEDFKIDKEKLIDYWICEGFIGEYHVTKRAKNKGYTMLGTLIRANLLMEVGSKLLKVMMHDVVRDLALWIASDFGKKKETFVVGAEIGLYEIPEVKDWGDVRKMSLMKNNIEEIICNSKCFEITTLFLQENQLKTLSGEFLWYMQKLVVLDLSNNQDFQELPEQIAKLASLQYLNLSRTGIKQLPIGFQDLKSLTHLDLSFTIRLCSLSGISNLLNLRILKLRNSTVHGDVSLVKELQLLEHLQVLTITISTELGLELISRHQRLASCIFDLEIFNFQQMVGFDISLLVSMKNLSALWVINSHVSEIGTYMKCQESQGGDSSDLHSPTISCFTNLAFVYIDNCYGVKDLTWLLFAPNLVSLHIVYSREVEEVINKEKATSTGIIITPFQKLEKLYLECLPNLKSIYWSPLLIPFLKYISVRNCPELRKFPLNAKSVPRVGELEIEMLPREKITELEWEDEDTKIRFWPSFKQGL